MTNRLLLLTSLAAVLLLCRLGVAGHDIGQIEVGPPALSRPASMPASQPPTRGVEAVADEPDNEFARANPGYKICAGAFYEREYLGKAMNQLAAAVGEMSDRQEDAARKHLRAFIYGWLDHYVRGNGAISREDLARCLALMDERFQGDLSPDAYKAYLTWRKDETGANSTLAFLMNPRFAIRAASCPATQPAATSWPAGEKYWAVRIDDGVVIIDLEDGTEALVRPKREALVRFGVKDPDGFPGDLARKLRLRGYGDVGKGCVGKGDMGQAAIGLRREFVVRLSDIATSEIRKKSPASGPEAR